MRSAISLAAVAVAALVLPAQALNTRTWVSGKGTDQAGCGVVANPCRTLQFARDQTSVGGEVDILDPAGYGAVAISKSISIINDGVGVAGLFSSEGKQAISIESGQSISVLLRGLTITGTGSHLAAVTFIANGSLSIQDCLFRDAGFVAYADAPSSIQILGSTFSHGVGQAISIVQSGNSQTDKALTVLIDRTTVTGSELDGVLLSKIGSSRLGFTIVNSTISSNGNGIRIDTAVGVDGIISNNTITQNVTGIWGNAVGQSVALTGNTISGNHDAGVASNAGMISFGDNKITGNGTDVSGYLTTVSPR